MAVMAELLCRTLGSVFWMVLVTLILCTDLDEPCAVRNDSAMLLMNDVSARMPQGKESEF